MSSLSQLATLYTAACMRITFHCVNDCHPVLKIYFFTLPTLSFFTSADIFSASSSSLSGLPEIDVFQLIHQQQGHCLWILSRTRTLEWPGDIDSWKESTPFTSLEPVALVDKIVAKMIVNSSYSEMHSRLVLPASHLQHPQLEIRNHPSLSLE